MLRENANDALVVLGETLLPLHNPSITDGPLQHTLELRLVALRGLLNGSLTARKFFGAFLPSRFRKPGLGEELDHLARLQFEAALKGFSWYRENSIRLFGHPFAPVVERTQIETWTAFFKVLAEVIARDQYGVRSLFHDNSIVIDAGANVGMFSAWAAHLCPNGQVFAFEPATRTYDVLNRNLSPYTNAHAVRSALGESSRRAELIFEHASVANIMADSRMRSYAPETPREPTDVTTIDMFVERERIPRVDLIKIDTEGYERNIIQGAKRTIERFSPILTMSAYHLPDDESVLPKLVHEIYPGYTYTASMRSEKNLLFRPR